VKNKEIEIAKDIKNNPKKFWQYTKSKTKTRIGISDLIMNNENGVETLTNSDKDKANTLSDFFSSVFTTETTDKYPSLEGINISYNMGTLVIDEEKMKKILCKVLEKFIRDHIVNHMKRNTLFSPKQFGFISGRLTSLQLLYVLERWTKILDEGGSLDCIYLDFM
jgi:DNA-binding NarL/FixJ family response regulator